MLIPFDALSSLPEATLNNVIKEYLFSQVEDGGFDALGEHSLETAIIQCKQALKQGQLMVEYSEEDESIAIRRKDDIAKRQD